jgi:hypothetical protein
MLVVPKEPEENFSPLTPLVLGNPVPSHQHLLVLTTRRGRDPGKEKGSSQKLERKIQEAERLRKEREFLMP